MAPRFFGIQMGPQTILYHGLDLPALGLGKLSDWVQKRWIDLSYKFLSCCWQQLRSTMILHFSIMTELDGCIYKTVKKRHKRECEFSGSTIFCEENIPCSTLPVCVGQRRKTIKWTPSKNIEIQISKRNYGKGCCVDQLNLQRPF